MLIQLFGKNKITANSLSITSLLCGHTSFETEKLKSTTAFRISQGTT